MTLTLQETFDKVAAHLLKQNQKAVRDGECVYGSPEGLSCAVGCLIKPELQDGSFEGASIWYIITQTLDGGTLTEKQQRLLDVLQASGVNTGLGMLGMLHWLQNIHDSANVANWPTALRYAADVLKLDPAVLNSYALEVKK